MKKKLISIVLSVLLVLTAMPFTALFAAASVTADGVVLELYDNGEAYRIIGCSSQLSGTLVLPSEYEGVPVKGIAAQGLSGGSNITEISLPASIADIENNAFYGCHSLLRFSVANGNPFFCTEDGILFNDDKTRLAAYPNGRKGAYVVPDSVVVICPYAFANNSFLSGITLSNRLTTIAESAFAYCRELVAVDIPTSVRCIYENAFRGCSSLSEVSGGYAVFSVEKDAFSDTLWFDRHADGIVGIGKTVYAYKGTVPQNGAVEIREGYRSITENAFQRQMNMTSLSLPVSLGYIGARAFFGCTGLTELVLPPSVACVDEGAFSDCTGLTSVTLNDGLRRIGSKAFSNCPLVTQFNVPDTVISIGSGAFYWTAWYDSQPDGVVYAGQIAYCYKGTMPENYALTIKEGTLGIGGWAFNSMPLSSVKLPISLVIIDEYAFFGCTSLKSITVPTGINHIGEYALGFTGYGRVEKIPEFVLYGDYAGIANRYADEYGITFIDPVPHIVSLTVEKLPNKLSYYTGNRLETAGLKLRTVDSNNTIKIISGGFSCSPRVFDEPGSKTVEVLYGGLRCSFDVNVTVKTEGIPPCKKEPRMLRTRSL